MGEHSAGLHNVFFRNLVTALVQFDELYARVRTTEKARWRWLAIDPVSKALPTLHLGGRTSGDAYAVVYDFKERLAPECVPAATSDGLRSYCYALTAHFGGWFRPKRARTDHWQPSDNLLIGQLVKRRERYTVTFTLTRMLWEKRRALFARLTAHGFRSTIQTAFIERVNLTIRQGVSLLTRHTWSMAQTDRQLLLHVEWWRCYYHFVRPHKSLRQPIPGLRRHYQQRTPTMALGLTDHLWTVGELLHTPLIPTALSIPVEVHEDRDGMRRSCFLTSLHAFCPISPVFFLWLASPNPFFIHPSFRFAAPRSVQLHLVERKTPIRAKKLSIVKRFERFLRNGAVRVRPWYQPFAARLVQAAASSGQVHLILDTSKVAFGFRLVMVSVAYQRRSLPLLWTWARGSRGPTTTRLQIKVLSAVQRLLPTGIRVSLVGDCEFGHPRLIEYVQFWGWDYALRQPGDNLVMLRGTGRWQRLDTLPLHKGQLLWIGHVVLTQASAYPTHLVLYWQRGHQKPWFLATNQLDPRATLRLYRRRMWIEEMFGDLKKHGFDLEASHLRHFLRLSRLTLAVCLL